MNKEQFMILRYIAESRREFDREDLPYMENCSSADIDRYLSDFLDNGLIDENYQITAE